MQPTDPNVLPGDLPAPQDDGAALHLLGALLPRVVLSTTSGQPVDIRALGAGPAVFFFYPRTGVPGQPPHSGYAGEQWDSIPGARGCTPQNCGFRDRDAEFAAVGVHVYGVSTNTTDHQREFKERNRVPFDLLSDAALELTRAMQLPTFEFPIESGGPNTLIRRMAWYCEDGRIRKVWYPVFPPDRNAATVLAWVAQRRAIDLRPVGPADAEFVRDELTRHWGGPGIWSLGRMIRADQVPGFIARVGGGGEPVGLVTYTIDPGGYQCEIVTLSTRLENRGVGERLLEAAVDAARDADCTRAYLTTTNDNTRAIGFYQKRGWRLAALHKGNVDEARKRHPAIPAIGLRGIPLRDELELEIWLR